MRPNLISRPARHSALAHAVFLSLSTAWVAVPSSNALAQGTTNPTAHPAETTLGTVTVTGSSAGAPTEGSPDFAARTANTATRLDLTPRETPQSMSVVTNAQMQAFGLRD
ncbi:MAG: TonB-dependent siderophore receptor, partial [Comamonadaceae bacterium]|nr:TonB-dependent siderophore receptor [Comamonadaceae bacterium]